MVSGCNGLYLRIISTSCLVALSNKELLLFCRLRPPKLMTESSCTRDHGIRDHGAMGQKDQKTAWKDIALCVVKQIKGSLQATLHVRAADVLSILIPLGNTCAKIEAR